MFHDYAPVFIIGMLNSFIVGYYDFFDGVDIRVIEDDGIFVDVDFGRSSIVVENGRWYVSNFD